MTPTILNFLLLKEEDETTLAFTQLFQALNYPNTVTMVSHDIAFETAKTLQPQIVFCTLHHKKKFDEYWTILQRIRTVVAELIVVLFLEEKGCYPAHIFAKENHKFFVQPISPEKLCAEINSICSELVANPISIKNNNNIQLSLDSKLFVKDKNKLIAISVKDVLWIEAYDNYTCLITGTQRFIVSTPFKNILQQLPENHFVKIHRSYAVQLQQIKRIEDNTVYILEKPLPVSKKYRDELLNHIYIL